jgi:hypothetical protein
VGLKGAKKYWEEGVVAGLAAWKFVWRRGGALG